MKIEPRAIKEVRDGEIVFEDGDSNPLGGLLVPVTLHQRTDLAHQLGATIGEPGMLAKDPIQVDAMAHTSVKGLSRRGRRDRRHAVGARRDRRGVEDRGDLSSTTSYETPRHEPARRCSRPRGRPLDAARGRRAARGSQALQRAPGRARRDRAQRPLVAAEVAPGARADRRRALPGAPAALRVRADRARPRARRRAAAARGLGRRPSRTATRRAARRWRRNWWCPSCEVVVDDPEDEETIFV